MKICSFASTAEFSRCLFILFFICSRVCIKLTVSLYEIDEEKSFGKKKIVLRSPAHHVGRKSDRQLMDITRMVVWNTKRFTRKTIPIPTESRKN